MPLFEFECEKCGKKIEVIQKFEDDPPNHCDQPMKKNLSGGRISLEFKGNGFYKTDYTKPKLKEKK